MDITAEQIQFNWDKFMDLFAIFEEPRKTSLQNFYSKYKDRIILMPASHKKEYHNAFPGGYIDHVLRVSECAVLLNELWTKMGADTDSYTFEELLFSAINHDLGKIGDELYEAFIPQTDQWRKEKLGENYMFNNKLPFASVPDRGLFLLQQNDIKYSFNEMIAIQTHDGLYDEGNKKYLANFLPEQKPRTCLPYIIHQADLMASRIEFENEWTPKFKHEISAKPAQNKHYNLDVTKPAGKKMLLKERALSTLKSESLKTFLDNL
jgi:hypothetical protein